MKENVFLGVANRRGEIDIPWRGTVIARRPELNYEPGQNFFITIVNGCAEKVELPTLQEIKQAKDETANDWARFHQIFLQSNLGRRVLMLRALDEAIREINRLDSW